MEATREPNRSTQNRGPWLEKPRAQTFEVIPAFLVRQDCPLSVLAYPGMLVRDRDSPGLVLEGDSDSQGCRVLVIGRGLCGVQSGVLD